MSRRVYYILGAVVAALLVVAAYALSGGRAPDAALVDREWVLVSYGPQGQQKAALATVESTATFDSAEGRVTGKGGVNSYSGGYTLDGDKLTFSPLVTTLMAGPQEAMDQESALLRGLGTAESYRVQGDRLEIATSDGELLVFRAR